jgi:REP element-mobilizing transposase RayT
MPRRPRIEISGFYHVVNRGVERRVVFYDRCDFEYFIILLSDGCEKFNITLHNYCLMNNHYHLLIELKDENLSKFMRYLNSTYAIYFNKKYKRVGHLWQGRFKSWYVVNEAYLYTLIRYIEQNPLKAKLVEKIEHYPYSSSYYFFKKEEVPNYLRNSWIVKTYEKNIKRINDFFSLDIDSFDLKELTKASNLVDAPNIDKKIYEEELIELFKGITDKKIRNNYIFEAYNEGYSQYMIAKTIGISQPAVNGIIKRMSK